MSGLLWTVATASFLGSLHCAGMCGPFAWLAASESSGRPRSAWPGISAYHGSRLILYAMLGALAGSIGLLVDLGGAAAGIQRSAAWLGGISMIVYALARLLGNPQRLIGGSLATRLTRPLATWMSRARKLRGWQRAGLIGAVGSLMPCGWLYAFVMAAAGTGNPAAGAGLMVAFWIGTVPILALVALGMGRIAEPIAARVPAILAITVLLIGVFTVATRAQIDLSEQHPAASLGEAAHYVRNIDQESLPCCCGAKRQE